MTTKNVTGHLSFAECLDMLQNSVKNMTEQEVYATFEHVLNIKADSQPTARKDVAYRGFDEYANNEDGRKAAETRAVALSSVGMRVDYRVAKDTRDLYLVRWYNPKYYRSFRVAR
jgi:hypothetical protein